MSVSNTKMNIMVVVAGSLLISGIGYVSAQPSEPPPGDSLPLPITESSSPQTKTGSLEVGSLCLAGECKAAWSEVSGAFTEVSGDAVRDTGRVGIGVNPPQHRLDIDGDVNAIDYCVGGDCTYGLVSPTPVYQTISYQQSFDVMSAVKTYCSGVNGCRMVLKSERFDSGIHYSTAEAMVHRSLYNGGAQNLINASSNSNGRTSVLSGDGCYWWHGFNYWCGSYLFGTRDDECFLADNWDDAGLHDSNGDGGHLWLNKKSAVNTCRFEIYPLDFVGEIGN